MLDLNLDYMGRHRDLFLASYYGNLSVLSTLLEDPEIKKYINHPVDSMGGQTHFTVSLFGIANAAVVQLLLRNGADPSQLDNMGYNALDHAARAGDPEILRIVLAALKDKLKNKSLDNGTAEDDFSADDFLADRRALGTGQNAFHALFSNGCGKDPNKKSANVDLKACLELLVENSANAIFDALEQADVNNITPLMLAKYYNEPALINALHEKFGVNCMDNVIVPDNMDQILRIYGDSYGRTPLLEGSFVNDKVVVTRELSSGADANKFNPQSSRSPLRLACCGLSDAEMVLLILRYVTDPMDTSGDLKKRSALHLAGYNGKVDILQVLINAGVDVNQLDADKRTVLHALATNSKETTERELAIELLFKNGINYNAVDIDGNTALDLARKYGAIAKENLEKLEHITLILSCSLDELADEDDQQAYKDASKRVVAENSRVLAFDVIAKKIESCILKAEEQKSTSQSLPLLLEETKQPSMLNALELDRDRKRVRFQETEELERSETPAKPAEESKKRRCIIQ